MCTIISLYQTKKSPAVINETLGAIAEERKTNPHGTGIVAWKNQKNLFTHREMVVPIEDFKDVLENYPIFHTHLRQATTGEKTQNNVHFWTMGQWMFAHNGMVYDYTTDNKNKTDSQLLFEELYNQGCFTENNKVDFGKVKKIVNTLGFWGRFIVINKETKMTYYFGDWHMYSLNKSGLLIASKSLEFKQKNFELFGVQFEKDTDSVLEQTIDGMFSINAETSEFKWIDEEFMKATPVKPIGNDYYMDEHSYYTPTFGESDTWGHVKHLPTITSEKEIEQTMEKNDIAELELESLTEDIPATLDMTHEFEEVPTKDCYCYPCLELRNDILLKEFEADTDKMKKQMNMGFDVG